MSILGVSSDAGTEAIEAIRQHPERTLLAVDFDGTLAPIITDPENAYADETAVAALARLGPLVGTVVLITGRPARAAVRLGGFADRPGLESMVVLGQYGVERWDAASGEFLIPDDPEAVTAAEQELPQLLDSLELSAARVEHKGRAVGVHTRELPDPKGAFDTLSEPLSRLADQHGLLVEPGKNVLELRSPGNDKGQALRAVVAERRAGQVVFAGDDLGDLPAFHAVQQLRAEGVPGLLVCSASQEEDALAQISDLVVDGPSGVAAWLTELAELLESRPGERAPF